MAIPASSGAGSSDDRELSLDELGRAYAEAMARHATPPAAGPGPGEPERDDQPEDVPGPPERPTPETSRPGTEPTDPVDVGPRSILEAMLFVGDPENRPLTPAQAAAVMRGVEASEIPGLVDQLNRRYAEQGRPYQIVTEGPGYRLALRPNYESVRRKFYGKIRQARLSQAAVDVLAIVAYRQPLTADEVSRLRGTPSKSILTQLVRRQLLRIERAEGKPRRTLYRVTDRFLELFGLHSLEDLPQTEDLEGV